MWKLIKFRCIIKPKAEQVYRRRYKRRRCIRKTKKYVLWEADICLTPKFFGKLLPGAKFHWNRAIDCWVMAKIDFWYGDRPPSWILKIIFGHVTVIEFQMCCCVPNFIKIWCFFRTDNYRDFTIFKMADVRHLKFYGSNNGFLEKPM